METVNRLENQRKPTMAGSKHSLELVFLFGSLLLWLGPATAVTIGEIFIDAAWKLDVRDRPSMDRGDENLFSIKIC